jgi:HEAT repeat protein
MKTLFFLMVAHFAGACAVAQEVHESGPVVNGRPMSFWLRTWVEKTTNVSQRVEAQKAFERAGTNVIPYLLDQLAAGDAARAHEDRSDPDSVEERRQAVGRTIAAEAALRYMGSRVAYAIPELTKLMASTNYDAVRAAAEILSGLGPQGVHVLVNGLTNANQEAREAIPGVLRHLAMGDAATNLLAELPALFNSLDTLPMNKAFDCRDAIVESVVAEFRRRLESTSSSMRYISARTLGEMGTSAQVAIPDLEKLKNDPEKEVRNVAAWALKHIQESDTWTPDYSKFDSMVDPNRKDGDNR